MKIGCFYKSWHFRQVTMVMVSFLFMNQAFGQGDKLSSDSKRACKLFHQAEKEYHKRNIEEASKLLGKTLHLDSLFVEAWLLMGDIQQQNNQPDLAVNAYKKAISIDSITYPNVYFTLGKLLYKQADYGYSAACFQKYQERVNLDSVGNFLLDQSIFQSQQADLMMQKPLLVQLLNSGSQLNTRSDEFINFVEANGSGLVLTRKSAAKHSSNYPKFDEQFYVAQWSDTLWSRAEKLGIPWLQGKNTGGMSMSADGRSMLFTGCYWPGGRGSCDLYYSNRLGNEWQIPGRFNQRINTTEWESQPVITADGKTIYFSAERTGGKGGADLWKTVYTFGDGWSNPINLGDSINSAGDEMAPFIHGNGSTLYFSSTGHPGLGGSDLFMAYMDERGEWGNLKNLGFPINSPADEVNLFIDLQGENGWVSSNRKGGFGGMDIWHFQVVSAVAPRPVIVLSGQVLDAVSKYPLKATVEMRNLTDLSDTLLLSSDSLTGEFLVVLNPENEYLFNINKKGYLFYSDRVTALYDSLLMQLDVMYLLQPIVPGSSFDLFNVYFDFNSDVLKPVSYSELNKLVSLMHQNPTLNIRITGHTDNVGTDEFNMELSQRRAKSVVRYLENQQVSSKRMFSEGAGNSLPIDSNLTEDGRARNRRTTVLILP